ncbi:MAG: DUF2332 family protein [Actinomycetota bacterium]
MGIRRDDRPGLSGLFADMADNCECLGAPTYADLAGLVARDPARFPLLEPYADARIGDMVPLRFFASVHRLVLERKVPALAMFYASVGGTPPTSERARVICREAFAEAVDENAEDVEAGLVRFPQTNEVGRASSLAGILGRVDRQWGLPARLVEIGSSAGLALRVDELVAAGIVPAAGREALPPIVERFGCDIHPVDPASTDGRLLLTSFVWPDHVERFERLRGALEVAARVPAVVVEQDAVSFVGDLRVRDGEALVLWHSAMWMYLPPEDRAAIDAELARLGASATARSPLVHVALEPVSELPGEQHVFHLRVTSWPELDDVPPGMTVTLARTPPAGLPVDWSVPCVGAIVHDSQGRLLVIQRGREPARGRWSLPGGRVHAGESFRDAVAREALEETGLRVHPMRMVGSVERTAPDGSTYDIRDFAAMVVDGGNPVAGDDADDARWVGLSELRALATSDGLLEALEEWGALPSAP